VCGRFTLTWDQWRRVADRLGLSDDGGLDASYRPRWNIAPTDEHFIVTSRFERRAAQRARWGLVNRWARDNKRAAQAIRSPAHVSWRFARENGVAQRTSEETHSGCGPYRPMMSRKRLFNAISAGLLPAESSQFSKSLIRPLCSTCGWLMVTTTLAAPRLGSSLQAFSRKTRSA